VEDEPDLHRGSHLLVDIHLPETSGTTIARVVRKEPIPEDHRGRVAVGLQMEDISPTFKTRSSAIFSSNNGNAEARGFCDMSRREHLTRSSDQC